MVKKLTFFFTKCTHALLTTMERAPSICGSQLPSVSTCEPRGNIQLSLVLQLLLLFSAIPILGLYSVSLYFLYI